MSNFWWTYGRNSKDRPGLVGPFGEELAANRVAERLDDSLVFDLPTKSQQQATRIVKAKLAERTGNYSTDNFGHGTVDGPTQDLITELQGD